MTIERAFTVVVAALAVAVLGLFVAILLNRPSEHEQVCDAHGGQYIQRGTICLVVDDRGNPYNLFGTKP